MRPPARAAQPDDDELDDDELDDDQLDDDELDGDELDDMDDDEYPGSSRLRLPEDAEFSVGGFAVDPERRVLTTGVGLPIGFVRAVLWGLPVAGLVLGFLAVARFPGAPGAASTGAPGGWLMISLTGLGLLVLALGGFAALLGRTPGRGWALTASVLAVLAALLLAAVFGVLALVRPTLRRLSVEQGRLVDRTMLSSGARGAAVAAAIVLVLAVGAFAAAVVRSGVLNRSDAGLLLVATLIAVIAAYSWRFLYIVAAMLVVAAGIGLAWAGSKLAAAARVDAAAARFDAAAAPVGGDGGPA
jgi:Amt family ammonium transporter